MGQVMPLRHHLRADEDVDLASPDTGQNGFDGPPRGDIPIETRDFGIREGLGQSLFELLRTQTLECKGGRMAVGAVCRKNGAMIAVVASKLTGLALVKRERHGAERALADDAAGFA